MTPIVLFKTHPHKVAAVTVCDLPDNELEKSFITLLTLFKYADTKRREVFCKSGCTHEWHNLDKTSNVTDNRLLTRIKKFFGGQNNTTGNIALAIWRGDEHILRFLFTNRLRFQQTNNARQQNKQGTFISLISIGYRLDFQGIPPHRQCFNVMCY